MCDEEMSCKQRNIVGAKLCALRLGSADFEKRMPTLPRVQRRSSGFSRAGARERERMSFGARARIESERAQTGFAPFRAGFNMTSERYL